MYVIKAMMRRFPFRAAARRAFQPMCLAKPQYEGTGVWTTLRLQSSTSKVASSANHKAVVSVQEGMTPPHVAVTGEASPPTAHSAVASSSSASHRISFDSAKAGLQRVNKLHVQRVIDKASGSSAFYKHEQRRAAQRAVHNESVVVRATQYLRFAKTTERRKNIKKAKTYEKQLEETRDLSQVFIHLDMDMFYAAVEERRDPSLKNIPYAVGTHAMLTTSNYVAREYGIRSGMPGFIAKKLCPRLTLVKPDFSTYEAAAAEVRTIARRYDPNFVTLGLDDLTLNITPFLRAHPSQTPAQVCHRLRAEVLAETQLPCSGGIAPTPAFAKLASNKNKPNGQFEVRLKSRAQVMKFVRDLGVRQMPGIGSAQESLLNALGIHTCGDVLKNKELIVYLFPEKTALKYLSLGLGTVRTHVERVLAEDAAEEAAAVDHTDRKRTRKRTVAPLSQGVVRPSLNASASFSAVSVTSTALSGKQAPAQTAVPSFRVTGERFRLRKSIGKSKTFFRHLRTRAALAAQQHELFLAAHKVLIEEGLVAKTITLEYTLRTFENFTVQHTLQAATADPTILEPVLAELAATVPALQAPKTVRLLGVRFTNLARDNKPSCALHKAAAPSLRRPVKSSLSKTARKTPRKTVVQIV